MKYLIILLVAGFLVEGTLSYKDKNHHSKSKSAAYHHSKHLRNRQWHSKSKTERATIVNSTADFRLTEYKLTSNESVYLNYNESAGFYGIWSYQKHTALLYANKDNLVGVYNTTSHSLLTMNVSSNQVTINTNVTIEFSKENLAGSFSKMHDLMLAGGGDHLSASVAAFFSAVLKADAQRNCVNCDFIKCLSSSFGNYVRDLRENISGALRQFGSGVAGGIDGLRGSIEAIEGNVGKGVHEIGGNIGVGLKGGFNLFGSLFTPFFSGARTAGFVFARFFGATIGNAVSLPRTALQLFSKAIGNGVQFINFNLTNQLDIAIQSTGTFFNNVTDALSQIFLGSGVRNFTTNVLNDGKKNYSISSMVTGDNDWLIRIGGKANLKLTINYNSQYNLLAFYNRDLNISTVFNGNLGFYSIYNTTSGVGLIISQLTGNAKVVADKTGKIRQAFQQSRNFTSGFILIGEAIESQSGGLNNLINLDAYVFNMKTLVFLLKSNLNIDMAFLGKGHLIKTINTNFNALFNAAHESFKQNGSSFDLSLGPLNILPAILRFNPITNNFMPIIRDIYTRLGGMFNPALIIRMAFTFGDNLRTGISTFVFRALQAALDSVGTVSGGINNAINRVLGLLPSANLDINFTIGYDKKPNNGTKQTCTCVDE